MTAIILAAGVGRRLHAAAGGRPKCLIEIGGRSLLARLLESLAGAGVRDAVVVIGFEGGMVRAAIGRGPSGMAVRFVENPRFHEGAILSLWAAREALTGPALVMDADVLCPPALVARLVRSPHESCLLLDERVRPGGEEQMLRIEGERVCDIVRGGSPAWVTQGESVGFLKLSAAAAVVLATLLDERVRAGDTGIEHEEVYPALLARVPVGFERVGGLPWIEIDFPADVERAERDVLPALARLA